MMTREVKSLGRALPRLWEAQEIPITPFISFDLYKEGMLSQGPEE